MRLIYSHRALQDFDEILHYIGDKNPQAAVTLGEKILQTCELFESHPEMGECKEELSKGVRRFMCQGYALYYRIDVDHQLVKLLRILHPSLDAKRQVFE